MLRCELCLQPYPDGTVFCDTCGTALESENSKPTPVVPGIGFVTPPLGLPQHATPAMPVQSRPAPRPGEGVAALPEHNASAVLPHARRALPSRVRLRMTNGKTFEVAGEATYIIGRRDVAVDGIPAVDFADHNGAACGISRRHAAIHIRPEGVFVEDLESRNETIHNGYRLMSRQLYPLVDGDELRLGTILLLVALD